MNLDVINIDPEILGGTPVFRGTRVPIESLFDWLESGILLDEFLDQFPSVSREQAIALLDMPGEIPTSKKLAAVYEGIA
jgi:uncharacterized protein (DUF433 family)